MKKRRHTATDYPSYMDRLEVEEKETPQKEDWESGDVEEKKEPRSS